MAFRDITEVLGPIDLPIRGKVYSIPAPSIADGIRLRAALDPDNAESLNDEEFYELLLGHALDPMRADGVAPDVIARAAFTALADFQSGRPAAEAIWETGLDPKVLTTYLAKVTQAAESSNTGADDKTPPRASTSGTKRPRK